MKERGLLLLNIGLFVFATVILATIQTSLWFQIFGYFPAPAFWIPSLIYLAIHRSTLEAVIVTYCIAFALTPMTTMPLGILTFTAFLLVMTAQFFKQRFFWLSTSYFMMTTGLGALLFHIYYQALSVGIEDVPLSDPEISSWLIEALLTPLVAPALYRLFSWFDKVTQRKQPVETSTEML